MALEPGRNLGPYRIVSPLGAGGMGEVYRAPTPGSGATSPSRCCRRASPATPSRAPRFEREARAVASLSHPGHPRDPRLRPTEGGAFAVDGAARGRDAAQPAGHGAARPRAGRPSTRPQIAAGPRRRARQGHRPPRREAGERVRDPRRPREDARLRPRAAGSSLLTVERRRQRLADRSPARTEPGTVLGTVGYMSPEQVRGQAADARSDIFSLGAVLYEMLTGQRAFRGETAAETMTAILRDGPARARERPRGDPAGPRAHRRPLPREEPGPPLPLRPRPRLRARDRVGASSRSAARWPSRPPTSSPAGGRSPGARPVSPSRPRCRRAASWSVGLGRPPARAPRPAPSSGSPTGPVPSAGPALPRREDPRLRGRRAAPRRRPLHPARGRRQPPST